MGQDLIHDKILVYNASFWFRAGYHHGRWVCRFCRSKKLPTTVFRIM